MRDVRARGLSSCAESQEPPLPRCLVVACRCMPAALALRGLRSGSWRGVGVRRPRLRGATWGSDALLRPAVGYGLRPSRDCARCSALRASSTGRRRSRPKPARGRAQRRLGLLGLAALGDPDRLRASPLPKSRVRPPRHPAPTTSPLLDEERLKCARAGERDAHARARSSSIDVTHANSGAFAPRRLRKPTRWRCDHEPRTRLAAAPRGLFESRAVGAAGSTSRSPARAHFNLSSSKRGDSDERGGGGCRLATSEAARRAGGQGRRAQGGRGARAALCDTPGRLGPATPRPVDEALDAEHRAQSREGRRP